MQKSLGMTLHDANNEATDRSVEKGRDPEESSVYAVEKKIDPEQGGQGNLDIGTSHGTSCRSRNVSQVSCIVQYLISTSL